MKNYRVRYPDLPAHPRTRKSQARSNTAKWAKEEGYHLAKVSEPLYVLAGKDSCYQALSADIEAEIDAGRISL